MSRSSGVLLHPTSLPGRFGIGELGAEAFRFADWLAKAGQRIWQVLPLGPTGYGDSPYQCFSAFDSMNDFMLSSVNTGKRKQTHADKENRDRNNLP